ncbi:hypothetical protein PBY51_022906 [Eleginops maclovinus]|uniref:Uncharacterized protein n=1 Tax=Eleginops maclovinus TaxID=56733 RepID=A0AAN7XG77_ELEMC|nr:hypothetical protein PBY51_022906 [Eleginops maclovinus]
MERLLHIFIPQLSFTASYCKEGFVGLLSFSLDSLLFYPTTPYHPALILSAQYSVMSRHRAEAVCPPACLSFPTGCKSAVAGLLLLCAPATTDLCEGNLLMNLDCASRLRTAPKRNIVSHNGIK